MGNGDGSALCNLIFEYKQLSRNNEAFNAHLYYTFNDGGDRWCSYIKLANETDLETLNNDINASINALDNNISEKAFNAAWPVGIVYVQYPSCDDPNTIFKTKKGFGCTWTRLSYFGAFFRAEGGDFASEYGSGLQKAALPNIKGGAGSFEYPLTATGPFKGGFYNIGSSNTGSSGGRGALEFDANNCNEIYGRREEVAPENYTIRIWKRTA